MLHVSIYLGKYINFPWKHPYRTFSRCRGESELPMGPGAFTDSKHATWLA